MSSKRFGYIIIIAVLSTFLVIGSVTARIIISYNTAYAAEVNASSLSSSSATPTNQITIYICNDYLARWNISFTAG
jgi:hypothetical protein